MFNKYVYYVGTVDDQDMKLFNEMLKLFPGVEIADSEENEGEYYDDWEDMDYYYHDWEIRLRVDLDKTMDYSKLMRAFEFSIEEKAS